VLLLRRRRGSGVPSTSVDPAALLSSSCQGADASATRRRTRTRTHTRAALFSSSQGARAGTCAREHAHDKAYARARIRACMHAGAHRYTHAGMRTRTRRHAPAVSERLNFESTATWSCGANARAPAHTDTHTRAGRVDAQTRAGRVDAQTRTTDAPLHAHLCTYTENPCACAETRRRTRRTHRLVGGHGKELAGAHGAARRRHLLLARPLPQAPALSERPPLDPAEPRGKIHILQAGGEDGSGEVGTEGLGLGDPRRPGCPPSVRRKRARGLGSGRKAGRGKQGARKQTGAVHSERTE
jgi:hypothetical protein